MLNCHSTFMKQKIENYHEFKVSLIYTMSSGPGRDIKKYAVSKINSKIYSQYKTMASFFLYMKKYKPISGI